MKEFVITGLTTPELKAEAETLLKENGYEGDVRWNSKRRIEKHTQYCIAYQSGVYRLHPHNGQMELKLTLTEAREMLKS